VCHYESWYVGRRSQRLEERIKQHIPKSIANPPTPHICQSLTRPGKDTSSPQFNQSAIGQHLLDNALCALHYNQDKFSVLTRTPFHLSPWKRLSSNLWIPFSANKNNSFTRWRSPKPLKLFPLANCFNQWELFSDLLNSLIGYRCNQWELCFSVYKPVPVYLHSILTISLVECETKSFGMNLLLHSIFKFCTTKRLLVASIKHIVFLLTVFTILIPLRGSFITV